MFKKDLRIFGNYTWQWFSTATFRRNNKSSSNCCFIKFREPIPGIYPSNFDV